MSTYTKVVDALMEWSTKHSYPHEMKRYFINPHHNAMFMYDIYVTNRVVIINDSQTTVEDKSETLSVSTNQQLTDAIHVTLTEINIFLTNFDTKFYNNAKRIEVQASKKPLFFNDGNKGRH